PAFDMRCTYEQAKKDSAELTGNIVLTFDVRDHQTYSLVITDLGYHQPVQKIQISRSNPMFRLPLEKSAGWYDVKVTVEGNSLFERHYAGRVETGKPGYNDPQLDRNFRTQTTK